ncbi:hypothetical protein RvY_11659 [Ramazzottius varieornatus]|uniref:Uncharacterized protein n=1 Tax=Ramazzottius varieornatus TaxID=947166 RepID=A0A1D1VIW8_RAMVA|nr:hypothetical protein RvY_11659 [Ramazzottius varieornatus]
MAADKRLTRSLELIERERERDREKIVSNESKWYRRQFDDQCRRRKYGNRRSAQSLVSDRWADEMRFAALNKAACVVALVRSSALPTLIRFSYPLQIIDFDKV